MGERAGWIGTVKEVLEPLKLVDDDQVGLQCSQTARGELEPQTSDEIALTNPVLFRQLAVSAEPDKPLADIPELVCEFRVQPELLLKSPRQFRIQVRRVKLVDVTVKSISVLCSLQGVARSLRTRPVCWQQAMKKRTLLKRTHARAKVERRLRREGDEVDLPVLESPHYLRKQRDSRRKGGVFRFGDVEPIDVLSGDAAVRADIDDV
ncbi:MAG TPA: hypothetical protein VG963_05315, partial [Polyangiaceae bacterium]|nr:hypothetical protein [Polyangiaceae bacterium]